MTDRQSHAAIRRECRHGGEVGDCAICTSELAIASLPPSSGFTKTDANPEIDGLIAGIFGGTDDQLRLCEDCTEPGGDYLFETFYGDEAEVRDGD